MNYDYKILKPFKWFVLQNFPFIEADFDAITNWQLFCKLGEEINKLINSENLTGQQVEDLTNAFNDLESYVNNYFENLDVQEEIDNKLDEMAEGGQLQEIISEYLQSNAIFSFNTVNDMKNATNLINGSFTKTYGYNTLNDKGGAFYKIRTILNTDTIDNKKIISLNNDNTLVAEIINTGMISPEQFGAIGEGITDDSASILYTINYATTNNQSIILAGKYYINNNIVINNGSNINIYGSKAQIGSTISGQNTSFANIIFGENGSIEVNGVSNVTFDNVGFSGTNEAIILKGFRNRILNCGFNGFTTAIVVDEGTNWNGENTIENCCFNTCTTCISLVNGSDGDIINNLADSTCQNFINSTNDAGYKIVNNHDYSQNGTVITGYNVIFANNYVDGFSKLLITGNSGFNISNNTFLGTIPEGGLTSEKHCISFSTATITSGNISSNNVACNQNNISNNNLFFVDLSNVTTFTNVSMTGNNIVVCEKVFYQGSPVKIFNTILNDVNNCNTTVINNNATLTKSSTQVNGSLIIAYNEFSLSSINSHDIARIDNLGENFIHFVKMNNSNDIFPYLGDRTIVAQGNWAQSTSMQCFSFGIRGNNIRIPKVL